MTNVVELKMDNDELLAQGVQVMYKGKDITELVTKLNVAVKVSLAEAVTGL